eukprot:6084502-Amphidinium_carterae.1
MCQRQRALCAFRTLKFETKQSLETQTLASRPRKTPQKNKKHSKTNTILNKSSFQRFPFPAGLFGLGFSEVGPFPSLFAGQDCSLPR